MASTKRAADGGAPQLYGSFVHSAIGGFVAKKAGLPVPPELRRYVPGEPPLNGPVLVGGTGRIAKVIPSLLTDYVFAEGNDEKYGALVFDATGITTIAGTADLYKFFQPVMRQLTACARVVVVGSTPAEPHPVLAR